MNGTHRHSKGIHPGLLHIANSFLHLGEALADLLFGTHDNRGGDLFFGTDIGSHMAQLGLNGLAHHMGYFSKFSHLANIFFKGKGGTIRHN